MSIPVSKPIRVLQVFAKMNRGGAESMIMNLYRNIDRSFIQFDFIVHTEDECSFDEEIYKLGGKIYRVPAYKGSNHVSYIKEWDRFFNYHPEYKIIHGHMRSTASIYLKIAKNYGFITIAHSHNTSSGNGFPAIAKNILQYPIRYIADYQLACSRAAGEWLFGKQVYKKDSFYILNNAIETKNFVFNNTIRDKIRKEFLIEDKLVVGHIGRFHQQKNHELVIEIFQKVYEKNNNALLLLVGEGELRPSIEKKVKNLGLNNSVIFCGVRSDVSELLQAMDVFLFPSLYEGLGIVILEAQASGLPCIVSDKIPREAFVTNLIQEVSLNSSIDIWAEKILKYTQDNKRKNKYKQIKSNGYDIVQTTEWL
ncbi:glycosyltransferase family 1 protein, partial [Bacillus sp. CRN 9]|nr:glycosyltransferase family 1 protein [Bacillus sp. CRN 9]